MKTIFVHNESSPNCGLPCRKDDPEAVAIRIPYFPEDIVTAISTLPGGKYGERLLESLVEEADIDRLYDALDIAVKQGNFEAVRKLLYGGIEPSTETILIAIRQGNPAVLKILLEFICIDDNRVLEYASERLREQKECLDLVKGSVELRVRTNP